MNSILRTTLASAFAIASIAGASMAFAADNGGKNGGDKGNNNSKSVSQTTGKKGKMSNKCAAGNKGKKDVKANCTK